jgi:hypothetical protein
LWNNFFFYKNKEQIDVLVPLHSSEHITEPSALSSPHYRSTRKLSYDVAEPQEA